MDEITIGELPAIANMSDDCLIPAEQGGSAGSLRGSQFKMYENYGLGIKTNVKPLLVDANETGLVTGWFPTNADTLNLPNVADAAKLGVLCVVARGDIYIYQEFIDYVDKRVYRRFRNDSGWESAWTQV